MADATFSITSRLASPATVVWRFAVSPSGINHELAPWLRMTMPGRLNDGTTIDDLPVGEELGRSWILLGGFVPVEYDDLRLEEVGPEMRFRERSRLASARVWVHEREVTPIAADACELRDRLELELRAPLRAVGGARLAPRIIRFLFAHRHRRLRQQWGEVAG